MYKWCWVIEMLIKTKRLVIRDFDMNMAKSVHMNSLDDDNRRFVPDEVFETEEDARETLEFLISRYEEMKSPLVYAVTLNEGVQIGHVQASKLKDGWEIGYHIGKAYTGNGYAKEAVKAFLPVIMDMLSVNEVQGICLADNIASIKVLLGCGFEKTFEGIGRYGGKDQEIFKAVYAKR